jgi:hypothetical protein
MPLPPSRAYMKSLTIPVVRRQASVLTQRAARVTALPLTPTPKIPRSCRKRWNVTFV